MPFLWDSLLYYIVFASHSVKFKLLVPKLFSTLTFSIINTSGINHIIGLFTDPDISLIKYKNKGINLNLKGYHLPIHAYFLIGIPFSYTTNRTFLIIYNYLLKWILEIVKKMSVGDTSGTSSILAFMIIWHFIYLTHQLSLQA